jgi:hypothetical protein
VVQEWQTPLIHFMGRNFNFKNDRASSYRHFIAQKLFIEKHYETFRCTLRRGVLECIGTIQPTDFSPKYSIRIRYKQFGNPSVRVLEPHIEPRSCIHIFKTGDLCLFHPSTQPWSSKNNLHDTIIPWTAEWLVFYELYLSEGRWLGPEVQHDKDLTATIN